VAYSMGHVGQVYLNVAGREPQGIVTAENYEKTRDEVIATLMDLQDENGRKLVTDLILREDTHEGPYAQYGPDIHLVLDDYNMIAFPLFATKNEVITDQIRGDSGCHRREGLFIAHGPPIRNGGELDECSIMDLAPTVMAMMDQPVPEVMDGRVLQEIFVEPPAIQYGAAGEDDAGVGDDAVRASESLQDAEERQIEDRLRSLGYL
jgi:predicted AlkP superfamily phosphohydrolase/phosphomutase